MLLETYVEAIVADADLADTVWELWDRKILTDAAAKDAWTAISVDRFMRMVQPGEGQIRSI